MAEIQDIQSRIENTHFHSFHVSLLSNMENDIRAEQTELLQQARKLETRYNDYLQQADASELEAVRKEIQQLVKKHEVLDQERLKIFDARQERLLRDRLAARLGGPRVVRFIDGAVLALIGLVLGLLFYEFSAASVSSAMRFWFFIIDTAACSLFLLDFFFRLYLAENRRWFWRNHWIDFVTSIPIPDAQILRFGRVARILRVIRVLRFLRVLRIVFFFWRGLDKLQNIFDVRLMKKSLKWGLGVMLAGALAIYYVEGDAAESVGSVSESIWWSFTTVVTGGFGDLHNPTTTTGRVLTVILIITGMIVVGVFTATLTSLYVGDDSDEITLRQKKMEARLDQLIEQLNQSNHPERDN
ncbi:MAG: ion transporter [Leptospiraceae bacterium]|nr:ion transporter [Leptospiraceae bacterium]